MAVLGATTVDLLHRERGPDPSSVRPAGGPPELLSTVDSSRREFAFRFPHVLPGGKELLITVWRRRESAEIVLIDLASRKKRVLTQGLRAFYLASGHLIVVKGNGHVVAARFAPGGNGIRGQAVEMFDGVRINSGGSPYFGLSPSGTVVYGREVLTARLLRIERSGMVSEVDPAWRGQLGWPALSPDESRMAVAALVEGRLEVWVKSLPVGPFFRVAADGAQNYRPFWSPDNSSVGFVSDLGGCPMSIATACGWQRYHRVDRPDQPECGRGNLVTRRPLAPLPSRLRQQPRRHEHRPGMDSTATALVATEAQEFSPSVSPDGKWMAYASDASGRDEVFVSPFPASGGGRIQVSVSGGNEPVWRPGVSSSPTAMRSSTW
jgi:hypothetical protein